MEKYTDDDIRKMSEITCEIAADYLGIASMSVRIGMKNGQLPIGIAVHNKDRYIDSWTYNIIAERLISYNHSKILELHVEGI